jgi:hypothetical protein
LTIGLYIDPAVHDQACAWFTDGVLSAVGMFPREAFMRPGEPCALDHFWIERMRIYQGKASKGEDPNDLIDVTGASYFVEACVAMRGGPRASYVYATDWKGQIKKPVHHMRIWSVLTPLEKAIIATAIGMSEDAIKKKIDEACRKFALKGKVVGYSWVAHNIFDAVGIGLWHLRRVGIAGHRF